MRSLAERLARGEETAFEQLYDDCADRLMRFLTLRLGCRQQAADVLQTTLQGWPSQGEEMKIIQRAFQRPQTQMTPNGKDG